MVFARVILPLSMPGIISGITMVFVPAVSTFYISQKLGSTGTTMIGDVIESQFKSANNPNLGAALSPGTDASHLPVRVAHEPLRRQRQRREGHGVKKLDKIYTVLIFLFLYLPMFVLMVASFNTGKDITDFEGFTLVRYAELFRDN